MKDVNNGGEKCSGGQGIYENSVQFFNKSETILKNKVY